MKTIKDLDATLSGLQSRIDVRFSEIGLQFNELEGKMNTRFAELEGKLSKHDWALGLIVTMNFAILLKVFWPHG